jgi:general secretion pathway protein A
MYKSFFGLIEKPFDLTPDPRYFYLSESHREALAALLYGVEEKVGLITLTGPVGIGKTMILASFLDQIQGRAEAASFSGAISSSRLEFLNDLCTALGIRPEQKTLFGLGEAIRAFAIDRMREGKSVVVLVDEAQILGLEELDHFHHLSNLETPNAKLLQIVLAGTEKLDEKLKDRSLEALWQRVAIRCSIEPIQPEETIAYIFHRMRIAGCSTSQFLTDDALWRVVNFARGIPRLINLVCNQAMIAAYASGKLPVEEEAVLEALREIEGGHPGIETGEIVERDEVRRMVGVVSRRLEGETPSLEKKDDPTPEEAEDSRSKMEAGGEGEVMGRERRRRPFLSWFRPKRRFAFALGLVLLLSLTGFLITVGLLTPGDKEIARVPVGVLDEDSTEKSDPGPETPKGVPERTGQAKEVAEIRSGLPALSNPEAEQAREGSTGVFEQGEDQAARKGATTKEDFPPVEGLQEPVTPNSESLPWRQESGDPNRFGSSDSAGVMKTGHVSTPSQGKRVTVRARDFAGIALEQYGRLDVEILKALRESNPQIRDWNNLDRNMQILFPDAPQARDGGANFYSIQVGAFRSVDGASRTAAELAKRGAQNLFLVKGGQKSLTLVCVGVFESVRQSSGSIPRMREWGFDDAFPTRIQEKRLEDILRPYSALGGDKQ